MEHCVTRCIQRIQQPYGGYLPKGMFQMDSFSDGCTEKEEERIKAAMSAHGSRIGTTVDYLTRAYFGTCKRKMFDMAIKGAKLVNRLSEAEALIEKVCGMDVESIEAAYKLIGFEIVYLTKKRFYSPSRNKTCPDEVIYAIQQLGYRSEIFFETCGRMVSCGLDLRRGYGTIVTSGDGDFLTTDGLWDLKCTKKSWSKDWGLQVLVYLLMGLRADPLKFQNVKVLGIFNAVRNESFKISLEDIPEETFYQVSRDVIGYQMPLTKVSDWQMAVMR